MKPIEIKLLQEKQNQLMVASLNYSGVLSSPYQFYHNEDDIELLMSQTFSSIVKQKYPEFTQQNGQHFKWNMESLDLRWKNRYCPVTCIDVGINKDKNTMMNQQQFRQQWYKNLQKAKNKLKKQHFEKNYPPNQMQKQMQMQISRCYEFDLFCYKTLMKVYCNVSDINKMGNVDASLYHEKKTKDFSKPYLCQFKKVTKTFYCICNLHFDIVFFQQTNLKIIQQFQNKAKNYAVVSQIGSDSIILLKKSKFSKQIDFQQANQNFLQQYCLELKKQNIEQVTPQQVKMRMNYNSDSIFQAVDNILLINVHLSSKKVKNEGQVKQISTQIKKILQVLPKYHVICGGDFNSKIDLSLFQNIGSLKNNSSDKTRFSVKKKRSMMQPQRHKAQKLDETEKDYIFSTFQIKKQFIALVNGQNIQDLQSLPLLPQTEHPYDHYMVVCCMCCMDRPIQKQQ